MLDVRFASAGCESAALRVRLNLLGASSAAVTKARAASGTIGQVIRTYCTHETRRLAARTAARAILGSTGTMSVGQERLQEVAD